MTPSLELALGAALLAAAAVFVAAFRFATRLVANRSPLPPARVRSSRADWLGAMGWLQRCFVAVGITSVFVMVVCAVGIAVLAIAS